MSARVLVLDLDGTVCLGDAPVLSYAAAVAAHAGPDLLARVNSFLADPAAHPDLTDACLLYTSDAADE